MRAFGYLRLSRERESSTSIEKQRESILDHCRRNEWEITAWFEDVDFSGTTTKRPGLQEMLSRLEETDVIVFHRLDRIMRSVIDFAKFLEQCRTADVAIVSATEPFDTSTATGRALVWLLASVAEIEAENTSNRITATHEHLLRLGRPIGKGRAFGWRHDPDTKQFIQVPEEATAIRAAAYAYLGGKGLRSIARSLADGTLMGIEFRAASGGEMTGEALKRILSSYRNIGYLARHGRPATEQPTLPPIMDVETFELLQAELRRRAQRRQRPRGEHELTGLVYCGTCGERMYAGHARRPVYKCRTSTSHGGASISKTWLEAEMAARLFAHVDQVRLELAVEAERTSRDPDPHSELRATLSRLEWGREELLRDFYQEGRLPRDVFEQQLVELEERLEGVRGKLRGVQDVSGALRARAAGLGDLEDLWPRLTVPERRGVFSAFVDRVTVKRAPYRGGRPTTDRVEVLWHPV